MTRTILVAVQAASFFGLGALLIAGADVRLGIAQLLLGIVTAVVYL